MNNRFRDVREIVERIKDIISKDIDGFIYDYHVANVLDISPNSLRIAVSKNRLSFLKKIVLFCYDKKININTLIF